MEEEGIAIVKITELRAVLNEVKLLSKEIKILQTKENLKSYSVQETANKIGVSYNTVRKLIEEEKLKALYINDKEGRGKCTIPAWSIEGYLGTKKQT